MGNLFSSYSFLNHACGKTVKEAFSALICDLQYHESSSRIIGDYEHLQILIHPYGWYDVQISLNHDVLQASLCWDRYADQPRRITWKKSDHVCYRSQPGETLNQILRKFSLTREDLGNDDLSKSAGEDSSILDPAKILPANTEFRLPFRKIKMN